MRQAPFTLLPYRKYATSPSFLSNFSARRRTVQINLRLTKISVFLVFSWCRLVENENFLINTKTFAFMKKLNY